VLSDHEWKSLHELERRLGGEDPEFPRSFEARAKRLDGARSGTAARVMVVLGVLLGALLLVAGSPDGAVAVVFTTGLIWAVRRYSNRPG
jgi:hypothetical protein